MLTSLSLTQLILISVAYLFTLFGIARITERGYVPCRLVCHPLVYILSLGVYVSAWAFYGTVGLAYQHGYGFFAIYLGIPGASLFAPVLSYPILRVIRAYQLSSLADLFAFRFHGTWVGALTTLFMLIGMLPVLALQIQMVTDSISILIRDPAQERAAFVFCTPITLFVILFDARHITTRERHEGLVFAIAFESLVRLVMFGNIGLYALYGVFGGPEGLEAWLLQSQTALTTLHTPLAEGPWRTLLLVSFAAVIAMPYMFHMIFIENLNSRALISASWGLPLFLLLMSPAVPSIPWAGLRLGASTTPEYYTIGLGLAVDSPALALAAFIDGISAANGLIIVMTLALSGMVLNHLVLPLYQPPAQGNTYRWLEWTRRPLVVAIIMANYAFYLLPGAEQDLSNLSIMSFVATLQFLPDAFSVLHWPTANRRGFTSGLTAGMLVQVITVLLPPTGNVQDLYLPLFDVIYMLDDSNWHLAALPSLATNVLVSTLVSLLVEASGEEKGVAEVCAVDNARHPQRRELFVGLPQKFASQLTKPLGAKTVQKEVEQALRDPHLSLDERHPYALRRSRDRIEANPSGLMGPNVAQDIVETPLPYKASEESYVTENIHFIESRLEDYHSQLTGLAAELNTLRRYHWRTLQDLLMGVCSLVRDQEVLMWNRVIGELIGVGAQKVVGPRLSALPESWKGPLERSIDAPGEHLHKQCLVYDGHTRQLNLHKAAIEESLAPGSSGLALLVEDLTETQLLEDKLVHSGRLASIGCLAVGVTHEIDNPIIGIACLAQNLREECEGGGKLTEISEQILDQTKRASRIAQSLMSLAHFDSHLQALEPVCLSEVAQEAIGLLSLNRHNVGVESFSLCDLVYWIEGDSQCLAQVLISLPPNARDISPSGGVIRIRSETSEYTVDLVIEGGGNGIPKAIMDQLFEPLFTTKDPGKGTGFGLVLAYSIVREHYEQIIIGSSTDHQREGSTRFRVTLPRHPDPTAELQTSTSRELNTWYIF